MKEQYKAPIIRVYNMLSYETICEQNSVISVSWNDKWDN